MAVRGARWAVAVMIVAAVGTTLAETMTRTSVNPFNFFGYFTVQSNLLLAAVLVVTAARGGLRWLPYARAAITVYVVIVGLVYGTLLAPLGEAGGVPVPWANTVLHIVTPIYVVVDWLLVGDRPPLRWSLLWVTLAYPAVWLAVVLLRGATDGWVPYPFLSPSQGYALVGMYSLVIFAIAIGIGALVWWATRWNGVLSASQRTAS